MSKEPEEELTFRELSSTFEQQQATRAHRSKANAYNPLGPETSSPPPFELGPSPQGPEPPPTPAQPPSNPAPDAERLPAKSIRIEHDFQDFFRNLDIIKIMRGIYRRFWIALLMATAMLLLLLPAGRHFQNKVSYSASASIIYTKADSKQVRTSGSTFLLQPISQPTLVDMLLTQGTIQALEKALGIDSLKEHISYNNQNKSDIITLRINQMPDEKSAVDGINQLAQIVVDNNTRYYRELATAAHKKFRTQRERAEEELARAVRDVELFQKKNQLLELNTQYENYFSAKNAAHERLSIAQVAHEGLRVRIQNYETMIEDLPDEMLDESTEDNPLKRRISNAEAALLQARIQYAADNPKVLRQEREIEELRNMLQAGDFNETRERTYIPNPLKAQLQGELMKLRSEEKVAVRQLEALQSDIDELDEQFQTLPGLEKHYAALLERRAALDSTYKMLQANEKSAQMTLATDLADVQIFNRAKAAEQSGSPLLGKVIPIAGSIFGFMSGIALILLFELLDLKVRTLHQLEKAYDAPCLAAIIDLADLTTQTSYEQLLPFLREISDRLNALARNQTVKTIGFCSALDHEGKSVLSFNLARYYQSLDKKVLYVSFDAAEHPHLPSPEDTAWPQPGIEEYLCGQTEFDEMRSRIEGVDVIRVQTTRPDLPDLAKGAALRRLWGAVQEHYDLIISDIPAILDHPFSGPASALQDQLLYVLASPVSDRKLVDASLEFLEDRGLAPHGILFNRVNPYYLEDIRQQRTIRHLGARRPPLLKLFHHCQALSRALLQRRRATGEAPHEPSERQPEERADDPQ